MTRPTSNKIISKDDRYDNTKFWIQFGIDLEARKVMLDETVDEDSVGWIIRGIEKMVQINPKEPIDITINSYGGYVYDGLALYDLLESLDCIVRTHATGKVMSCGLILFLVGDERTATTRTTFMAHSIAGGVFGKLYELKNDVKETDRLHGLMLDILESQTSKTRSWWKKEIEHVDRYYDVEKAKKLGILD